MSELVSRLGNTTIEQRSDRIILKVEDNPIAQKINELPSSGISQGISFNGVVVVPADTKLK